MLDIFFFFNDTATTEIYTLSLHDALPISLEDASVRVIKERFPSKDFPTLKVGLSLGRDLTGAGEIFRGDRKSTRLNSSHTVISYAVFCLKKKINAMI